MPPAAWTFRADFPDKPVVALGADKGLRDRSRFDAAHELGHLVLHGVTGRIGDEATESQAHEFAAAFRMLLSRDVSERPRVKF